MKRDVLGTRVVVFGRCGLEDDGRTTLPFTQYQVQIDIGPMTGNEAQRQAGSGHGD